MKQVIFRREASADVREAYRWYEQQEPGLGAEFREQLRLAVQRLSENPHGYRVLIRDTRRARLKRFPYSVFFRIYPDAVVVVAVMHMRRHPRSWQQR